MKPITNIYSKVCSIENLYRASKAALARGRRYRGGGAEFSFQCEREISTLRTELLNRTYKHGRYTIFKVYDPKERTIAAAPFRDRVVHHAVNDVIEPILDRMFIHDSYACRKDKGTHRALRRADSFLHANRYALHLDVRSYFPSIRHDVLKSILQRYIVDEKTLWLLNRIIDSSDYLSIEDLPIVNYLPRPPDIFRAGKELATVRGQLSLFGQQSSPIRSFVATGQAIVNLQSSIPKGLPIGNLTSQFFANLYLNELDQYMKHQLKCRYYLRYMDDMVIFGNDKAVVRKTGEEIARFTARHLRLKLHEGASPVPVSRGLTFLGFRLFPNHWRLKSDNIKRFVRRMKGYQKDCAQGRMTVEELNQSVRSWVAHASYGQTWKLRSQLLSRFSFTFGKAN